MSTDDQSAIIRSLGIDPDDMFAVVDNTDRIEAALQAECEHRYGVVVLTDAQLRNRKAIARKERTARRQESLYALHRTSDDRLTCTDDVHKETYRRMSPGCAFARNQTFERNGEPFLWRLFA